MNLNDPVEKLPYVGPTYAKRLEKLQINTIEDLILKPIPYRNIFIPFLTTIFR